MGFWSDTFGGGNSFSESVANTFTPNDGASYVGGQLVDDASGASINPGGTTSTGNTISGSANNTSNDTGGGSANTGLGSPTTPEPPKIKGVAPTNFLQKVSPLGIIGKLSGWANNLDPAKDITGGAAAIVGGRQVYDNGKMQYSYNFLGLPYEVKIIDGAVVDKLSIKYDKDGKPDPNGMTGYERMAQDARDSGDNDRADQIMQEATDNAQDAGGGAAGNPLDTNSIIDMAKAAGMVQSNADIEAILADPQAWLSSKGAMLSERGIEINGEIVGATIDGADPKYNNLNDLTYDPATVDNIPTIEDLGKGAATTYDADTSTDRMVGDAYTVNAATGQITDRNLVDAEQIDMTGAATGVNADGSTSVLGNALNDFATQNISKIIDTSTVAGKLLADKLGQGNYTDSKATVLGQMKIISDEFKDSNGNPKIPAWAQGLSRDVQRTMAFSGATGTAAIAAMSNAIMEATLGVAQSEATFFQTLTTKNLDNRQQAIINKASVLANFEVANLDARQTANVQNAKAFLEMDLTNLTNIQQAEVINTQQMVQALFNDQSATNASRLFSAETANDFTKFYDTMSVTIATFNAEQEIAMKRFNAGEINDASEFNATIENSRDQFYSSMQYNIDLANAKWRQTVETENTRYKFEAASLDVKNTLDISTEAMNQLWDRVDNMLDYIFKGAEGEANRDAQILAAQLSAQANSKSGSSGIWGAIGSIGAAYITRGSDERMKTDIQYYDTVKGLKYYTWKWNEKAKSIGWDRYPEIGVIAQQVQKTHPEAVVVGPDGYLMVNYGMLQ